MNAWNDRRGKNTSLGPRPKLKANQPIVLSFCFAAICIFSPAAAAQNIVPKPFAVGEVNLIRTKETLGGYLLLPESKGAKPRKLEISGSARIAYRERILDVDAQGIANRTVRSYQTIDSKRRVDNQDQEAKIRDAIKNKIVISREKTFEKPYHPAMPMEWMEVDFVSRQVFVPLLAGFFPNGPIEPGKKWNPELLAVEELTGLVHLEAGSLTCTGFSRIESDGQQLDRIAVSGTVTGWNDEYRQRNRIEGVLFVSAATGKLHSAVMMGELDMLEGDKVVGKLTVQYDLLVEPSRADGDLADDAIGDLPTTPSDDQMALRYENAILGIEVIHRRNWFLETVEGAQLLFKHKGTSIVVTVEQDGKTPSLESYQQEVEKYLKENKIAATRFGQPNENKSENGRIGLFRLLATIDGQQMVVEHWVLERGKRGATIAATVPYKEFDRLRKDVMALAYNITFTKPSLESTPPADRMNRPQGPSPLKSIDPRTGGR